MLIQMLVTAANKAVLPLIASVVGGRWSVYTTCMPSSGAEQHAATEQKSQQGVYRAESAIERCLEKYSAMRSRVCSDLRAMPASTCSLFDLVCCVCVREGRVHCKTLPQLGTGV